MMNIRGPSIDLFGTPEVTGTGCEKVVLSLIACVLFVRWERKKDIVLGVK